MRILVKSIGGFLAPWKRASDIGSRIRGLREWLDLTQAEFGKLGSVTYQTVSDWEVERSKPPRSRLRTIAENVGGPLAMFEEGGPKPKTVVPRKALALREEVSIPGYVPSANPDTREAAASDARRVAGEIVIRRMAGRGFMPVSEAIEYMAAVSEAAAGRTIQLPPMPPVTESPLDQVAADDREALGALRAPVSKDSA